jgi:glutathione S-transferase
MSPVEIFTKPGCGWAQRNYALLIEKGLRFRTVLSADAAGRKTDEFLSLSPYAATPVLRVGADVVWESSLINEYLEERFPGRPLMPADPGARAAARLCAYHCDGVLMPAIKRLVRAEAGARAEAATALDEGLAELAAALRRTGGGPFWGGQRIALPDLVAQTVFESLEAIGEAGRLAPSLRAWKAALAAHPAIRAAAEIAAQVSYDVPVREIDVRP